MITHARRIEFNELGNLETFISKNVEIDGVHRTSYAALLINVRLIDKCILIYHGLTGRQHYAAKNQ